MNIAMTGDDAAAPRSDRSPTRTASEEAALAPTAATTVCSSMRRPSRDRIFWKSSSESIGGRRYHTDTAHLVHQKEKAIAAAVMRYAGGQSGA